MASSASGQNFLRLLFGGAQRGLDQSFQRQGQNTNLALQLQQMLTRQQEFGKRTDLQERGLDLQQQGVDLQEQNLGVARQNAESVRVLQAARTADVQAQTEARKVALKSRQDFNKFVAENKDFTGEQRTLMKFMAEGRQIPGALSKRVFGQDEEFQSFAFGAMQDAMFDAAGELRPDANQRMSEVQGILQKQADARGLNLQGYRISKSAEPDGLSEATGKVEALESKMTSIAHRQGLGLPDKKLTVDESLQAIAQDDFFPGMESTGNEAALERAGDLLREGFISPVTYRMLLQRMGLSNRAESAVRGLMGSVATQVK